LSRGARIKEAVRRLKIIHGDDTPMQVIASRNIVLCYLDENCVSNGAYAKFKDIQYIYINTKLCDFQRRMTYAHELGHSVLHPSVDTFELKNIAPHLLTKYENEAKLFAAEYLLSDDIFEKYPNYTIFDIAREECVSVELVELKHNNLDKSNFSSYYAI